MNLITRVRNVCRMVPVFATFGLPDAFRMATQVNELIEQNIRILDENVIDGIVVENVEMLRLEAFKPYGLLPSPKE